MVKLWWLQTLCLRGPEKDAGGGGLDKKSDPDFKEDDEPEKMDKGDTVDPDGPDPDEEDPDKKEDEPGSKAGDKPKSVPYKRFSGVITERNSLKDLTNTQAVRIRELEQLVLSGGKPGGKEEPKVDVIDLDKLEGDYMAAVSAGEHDKALLIRKQIRTEERRQYTEDATKAATRAAGTTTENDKVDAIIAKAEKDFPILNDKSDEYDPEVVEDVLALQKGYMANKKMSASAALVKAIDKVTKQIVKEVAEEEKTETKEEKAARLKKESVQKNVNAAKKTPPKATGGDKADPDTEKKIEDMTDEEIDALPKSKLRELRGDAA